ncbi:DUF4838 domain-containing protein [Victivallis sp. Marseille-Q1083]|uniref:DUF4838 domain-containing protein n=1 Tax=Victivallis sp. Marseille-Q1083 TaxID=2717288 RepID=UPI001589F478|nr:DUF4838 domain-containing protein [Victivallis sp. Marseille-Q1083]
MKRFFILFLLSFRSIVFADLIATGESPSPLEETAAFELQNFMQSVTGREFTVVRESELAGRIPEIYLGQTGFARDHRIDGLAAQDEEWILRTCEESLVITGGRPAGTLYGVYAFLEKLGVAFLTEDETVIPRCPDWRPELIDGRGEPAFRGREIYDERPYHFIRQEAAPEVRRRYWLFKLRSRINGASAFGEEILYRARFLQRTDRTPFCHNFYRYVPPETYFAEHPEYFTLGPDGKRTTAAYVGQLCLSHPDLVPIALESLREFIRRDRAELPPEQWPTFYDISQNDGGNTMCGCENCRKIVEEEDGESGLLLRFINPIASAIRRDYPELTIRTFAYSFTAGPPRLTRPESNVLLQYCAGGSCYRPMAEADFRELAEWNRQGATFALWDYWNMGMFFNPPRPETMVDAIAPDLRRFRDNRVTALFLEAEKNPVTPQNFIELQYYLASRLMVDPDLDDRKLIAEYMTHYYGPAAPLMTRYLDRLREGVAQDLTPGPAWERRWRYLDGQFMLDNYRLLLEAEAAAQSPRFQARVRAETIPLFWQIVYWRQETEADFREHGISVDAVRDQLKNNILEYLDRTDCVNPGYFRERFAGQFEILEANLTAPEPFRAIEPKYVFGYPQQNDPGPEFQCSVTADPDSIPGKTLLSRHPNQVPGDGNLFGTYDFAVKDGKNLLVAPEDEAYHWYRIPEITLGSNCLFFAHRWHLQINLSQAYAIPNAENSEDNCWDLWFHARFTGPAWIPGSAAANTIAVDMVILTRPGTAESIRRKLK